VRGSDARTDDELPAFNGVLTVTGRRRVRIKFGRTENGSGITIPDLVARIGYGLDELVPGWDEKESFIIELVPDEPGALAGRVILAEDIL
jgi:hypothetical protein